MNESLIVLQARYGSRRLRGKALATLGRRSILVHCLDRLMMSATAPVVLATTTAAEDDVLAAAAVERGVPVVRGPGDDVLRRFVIAATRFRARFVVRATADNPAVDIDSPRRTLAALIASGADYAIETGLPYGACVEAMTAVALQRANAIATSASDREHVTPLIRRHSSFRAIEITAPVELRRADLRLTVDTADDLAYLRAAVGPLYDLVSEPSLKAIIYAADTLTPCTLAAAS
jgi:spore coat polysaccharide biosynthesis protein SpsF